MVKATTVLHKINYALLKKQEFARRGVYKVNKMPPMLKKSLQGRNVAVVDAVEDVTIQEKWWKPEEVPKEIPPDFRNTWYKEPPQEPKELSFCLPNSATFSGGIQQACLLTKTQSFKGLPQRIHQCVRKAETLPFYKKEKQQNNVGLYQLGILQSQIWDPTMDRLPKRKDPDHMGWVFRRELGIPDGKSAKILLNYLLYAASHLSSEYPEIVADRRTIYKPEIDMDYDYLGNSIIVRTVNECLTYGNKPLPPFLDRAHVEKSKEYTIPTMDPILPTIDLEETDRTLIGTSGGLIDMEGVTCSYPHTLYRATGDTRKWTKNQAYNLMLTFATAVTEARKRYGMTEGVLPKPITIQNVNMHYDRVNYIFFQLNTLDTHTPDGVKNFAWFDHHTMFKRVKTQPWKEKHRKYQPTYFKDLQMKPFLQFLAVHLNGVNEL